MGQPKLSRMKVKARSPTPPFNTSPPNWYDSCTSGKRNANCEISDVEVPP